MRRLFALTFLAAAGCAPAVQVAQVEGVVKRNGQPLPKVYVQFLPDPEKKTTGPDSSAETDDQGRYKLNFQDARSNSLKPGAVIGWHRVILVDVGTPPAPQGSPPSVPRFGTNYSAIATTPLKYEVKSGTQTIDVDVK